MQNKEAAVYVSLGSHSEDDLHKIPLIEEQIQSFFYPNDVSMPAENVYFSESLGLRSKDLADHRKEARRQGSHFNAYLTLKIGNITPAIIEQERLAAQNGGTIFDSIDSFHLFSTGIFLMLDRVAQSKKFSFAAEIHAPDKLNRINGLLKKHSDHERMVLRYLQSGNVDQALDELLKGQITYADVQSMRDKRFVDLIRDQVNDGLKKPGRVRLFTRLGGQHTFVADDLKKLPLFDRFGVSVTASIDPDCSEPKYGDQLGALYRANSTHELPIELRYKTLLESLLESNSELSFLERSQRQDIEKSIIETSSPAMIRELVKNMPIMGVDHAVRQFIAMNYGSVT